MTGGGCGAAVTGGTVFDDRHGRDVRPGQVLEEGREQLAPVRVGRAHGPQPPPDLHPDLVQRPQRSGREAPVAGRPPPAQIRPVLAERLQQRRLAHTGLACHEREPPSARRGVRRVLAERAQEERALQQLHGAS
jgi:hypothetical protein